jgi:hypothetical protein
MRQSYTNEQCSDNPKVQKLATYILFLIATQLWKTGCKLLIEFSKQALVFAGVSGAIWNYTCMGHKLSPAVCLLSTCWG